MFGLHNNNKYLEIFGLILVVYVGVIYALPEEEGEMFGFDN